MNEARDEMRAYFDNVTKASDIRRGMRRFEKRIKDLAEGKPTARSQMLVGPPGCGKGTIVQKVCADAGRTIRLLKNVSPQQLKFELDEARQLNDFVFVDDADGIFKNEASVETLMSATSGKDDAFGRRDSIRNRKCQEDFSYEGVPLVICTNTDVLDPKRFSAVLIENKIKPFLRRIQYVKINASHEDRYLYTCFQIICEHVLRKGNVHPSIINLALETLAKSRHRFLDVSVGAVKNLMNAILADPEDWRDDLFFDRDGEAPPLGRIPKLIPADRMPAPNDLRVQLRQPPTSDNQPSKDA